MTDDDLTGIAADDQLVDDIRHGRTPATASALVQMLGAWRDHILADPPPPLTNQAVDDLLRKVRP